MPPPLKLAPLVTLAALLKLPSLLRLPPAPVLRLLTLLEAVMNPGSWRGLEKGGTAGALSIFEGGNGG
jgi:hypothetical protein